MSSQYLHIASVNHIGSPMHGDRLSRHPVPANHYSDTQTPGRCQKPPFCNTTIAVIPNRARTHVDEWRRCCQRRQTGCSVRTTARRSNDLIASCPAAVNLCRREFIALCVCATRHLISSSASCRLIATHFHRITAACNSLRVSSRPPLLPNPKQYDYTSNNYYLLHLNVQNTSIMKHTTNIKKHIKRIKRTRRKILQYLHGQNPIKILLKCNRNAFLRCH